MNKILNYFENLSVKDKIIYLLILTIIIIILTRIIIIKNNDYNEYTSLIDYKDITIDKLLNNYIEYYDNRDIYAEIKSIIQKMSTYFDDSKNLYDAYYSVVDTKYSSYISKNEFSEKMYNIFREIRYSTNGYSLNLFRENGSYNIYIVEIYTNKTIGYMGFILDSSTQTYSIFYIE